MNCAWHAHSSERGPVVRALAAWHSMAEYRCSSKEMLAMVCFEWLSDFWFWVAHSSLIEDHPGLAAWVQAVGSIAIFAVAEWRASTAVARDAARKAEYARQSWAVVEPALLRLAGLGREADKCAGEASYASLFVSANFNEVEINGLLHELINSQALSLGDTELANMIGYGKSLAAGLLDVFGSDRKVGFWVEPGTMYKLARIASFASIIQATIDGNGEHAAGKR